MLRMDNTTHHLVMRHSGSPTRQGGSVSEMVCEYCGQTGQQLAEQYDTQDVTTMRCPKAPRVKRVEESVTR